MEIYIYIINGDSNGNRTKYNGIEWNMDINDMRYLMILVELYLYESHHMLEIGCLMEIYQI